SWAVDYGGARKKKPSRFLNEIGMIENDKLLTTNNKLIPNTKCQILNQKTEIKKWEKNSNNISSPNYFSYTQLAAFSNCPYQYRFAHILKVPVQGKEIFSFGKTLHITLQKLFNLINEKSELKQSVKLAELLELYSASWIDDWYESKEKKEERRKQGQEILTVFYEKHKNNWPTALFLEKGFNIKLADGNSCNTIRGVIDRIDQIVEENGVNKIKIVDYKTGKPKSELTFDEKEQLFIYQMAAEEIFRQPVVSLAFYYLDNNTEVEFLGSKSDLIKVKDKVLTTIAEIKKHEFPPKPSILCKFCDFKDICEFKQNR
ncbi:MAG: PD-(D/E)XK nuclease family protein, partial [bacterium]|nr:PD-(D/E)XK nuclease family protein [bacterium]